MRSALLALICTAACGDNVDGPRDALGTADAVTDAAIDARACSGPRVPGGCIADGLATVTLDGAWTLTGTRTDFGTTEPYTATVYLAQMGTGACSFGFSTAPISPGDPLQGYFDGTVASYALESSVPHVVRIETTLCAREGDGALLYRSRRYVSMPMVDEMIEGVLSR